MKKIQITLGVIFYSHCTATVTYVGKHRVDVISDVMTSLIARFSRRIVCISIAYSSTLLALPQLKSECPAAEPSVISESTIHCGVKKAPNSFQKWEIRLRQKCTNMHYFHTKNQKNLGGGRHSRGGHPLPRPYPFGACGASTLARPYSEIQSTSAPEW